MSKFLKIILGSLAGILLVLVVLNLITTRELNTEVTFDAPKEKVWEVLTDTPKYSEWNPFITSIKGELKQGGQVTNVMVNNGSETVFTPTITALEKNKKLEWLGSAMGGMFKGKHFFELSDVEGGKTKMLHGEKFSGLLSGLVMQMIGKDTHANFDLMNGAMKNRVEAQN